MSFQLMRKHFVCKVTEREILNQPINLCLPITILYVGAYKLRIKKNQNIMKESKVALNRFSQQLVKS